MKEGERLHCPTNHVRPGSKLSQSCYTKANVFPARQNSPWSKMLCWLTGFGQHPIIRLTLLQHLAYNSTRVSSRKESLGGKQWNISRKFLKFRGRGVA